MDKEYQKKMLNLLQKALKAIETHDYTIMLLKIIFSNHPDKVLPYLLNLQKEVHRLSLIPFRLLIQEALLITGEAKLKKNPTTENQQESPEKSE